jgi:hypothetical protein
MTDIVPLSDGRSKGRSPIQDLRAHDRKNGVSQPKAVAQAKILVG